MNPKAEAAFERTQEQNAPYLRIVRLENRVAELERALHDLCAEADIVARDVRAGDRPILLHLTEAVARGYKLLTPIKPKEKRQ